MYNSASGEINYTPIKFTGRLFGAAIFSCMA